MIVVGGTYQESCRDPFFSALIGSGMRAAACLSVVDPAVEFHSAIEPRSMEIAGATAAGLGIRYPRWVERSGGVEFCYDTPLSAPTLIGRDVRTAQRIAAKGGSMLAFGMVEGLVDLSADALVVDPQHDIGLDALRSMRRERLAVVASAGEITKLAPVGPVRDAAAALLDTTSADVVVAKMGALGALVVTSDRVEGVGPKPAARTWPIGSGDAFSAGFAYAWAQQGADAVEAARIGCATAAAWCTTQTLPLAAEAFTPVVAPLRNAPKVYLAGPFFDVAQRWLVNLAAWSLAQLGADVFSPFHEVGIGLSDVASLDLAGLDDSASVLALIDGLDAGTLFEVGWASRAGIPVVAYCERCTEADLTMVAGSGAVIYDDLASAVYAAVWAAPA